MLSFIIICVVLLIGHFLRMKVRFIQKIYLPSCVVAGVVALILIQLFKGCDSWFAADFWTNLHLTTSEVTEPWSVLPGFLINIVFACLFLGHPVPKFKELYHRAGPQFAYGQIVAWGQYAVAIGFFLGFIRYVFPLLAESSKDMFGVILPVGFEGGHGTAAGLEGAFIDGGWAAGKDYAMASATFGIMTAIIVGTILINWAVRKGHTFHKINPQGMSKEEASGIIPQDKRPSAGKLTVNSDAMESLTFHIAIVGLACLLGYLFKESLLFVEIEIKSSEFIQSIFGYEYKYNPFEKPFFSTFPLFPLCMLGGLFVQIFEDKFDKYKLIDMGLTRRIQNTALDFLVVAAIATIKIEVIMDGIVPLLMLVVIGILWNVGCLLWLARRVFPDAWFERAIAEMGQSMGVTATGLLLLRVVDPDYESPAADAFATKQLLHEPINGGGLWDSSVIPLLIWWGSIWPIFGISLSITIFWLGVLFIPKIIRRMRTA